QVNSIELCEPPGIQMQDILEHPFRSRRITESSKHENTIFSAAYWQARILDLPGCLAQTHLPGSSTRFNLVLTDPIERFLDDASEWRGVAGEYVIELGQESSATGGSDSKLPTLRASVNAFTRLWLGVQQASVLSWSDDLSGPHDLMEQLDRTLCLPTPQVDWDF
ncbi:hypothetical protein J7J63_02780, partial [Candidatus Bipolaricaulota bacterium]|nr:hypothetical protein [Candidatus Bipolaricaulota bacterium]